MDERELFLPTKLFNKPRTQSKMIGLFKSVRQAIVPVDGDVRVKRISSSNVDAPVNPPQVGEIYNWVVEVFRSYSNVTPPSDPRGNYYWFAESFHSSEEGARSHARTLEERFKRVKL